MCSMEPPADIYILYKLMTALHEITIGPGLELVSQDHVHPQIPLLRVWLCKTIN